MARLNKRSPATKDRDEALAWTPAIASITPARPRVRARADQFTVRAMIEAFFAGAEARTIQQRNGHAYAPGTLRQYRSSWNKWIEPSQWTNAPAAEVGAGEWQTVLDDMSEAGLKRNSVNVARCLLGAAYRWASSPRRLLVPYSPIRNLELPPFDETPRLRVVMPDQIGPLLAVLDDDDQIAWRIAFWTGLRVSEIEALDVEDTEGSAVSVRWGKTHTARRVPMPKALRSELAAWKLRKGLRSGALIPGRRRERWSQHAGRERSYAAWDDAKLSRIGFHEARHTYASWLVASGADLATVRDYLGHSSLAVTDRYVKRLPGRDELAAAKLDALLEGIAQ
jgi:integrase